MVLEARDILVEVFSHLPVSDAQRANQVCHAWHEALRDPLVVAAWTRRRILWEKEEELGRYSPSYENENSLFTSDDGLLIEWAPSRLYEEVCWGDDTTILEVMQNPQKRGALLSEARNRESTASTSERLMSLREHCSLVDSMISKWIHHMDEKPCNISRPSEGALKSNGSVGSGALLVHQNSNNNCGDLLIPDPSGLHEAGDAEDIPPTGPMDSPRETFPCNFLADQSDITQQHSLADCQPPPLRKAQKLRSNQAAALRSPGAMAISRVLHFGDSEHHISEGDTAASTSAGPWNATSIEGEQKNQSFSNLASTSIGILPCELGPDSFVMRGRGEGSHRARYIRSWNGTDEEITTGGAKELQRFAEGYSVTKHVDLFGTHNHGSNEVGKLRKDGFIQRIVTQVAYENVEIKITETFGWQHSSTRQWLAHHIENADGADPAPHLQQAAAEREGVMMTHLERRYDSVLSISMRQSSCQHTSRHRISSWDEILYMSQHTGQQFTPTDAVRLNHVALDSLRSAWGLLSFDDESIIILAILLSGHQPVQMAAILSSLFDTFSLMGCVDPPGRPDEQTQHETEVTTMSSLLPGTSSGPPACGECCLPRNRHCFAPHLVGTLPKILCMTDSSFLEEISWVTSLARNDDA